MPGGNPGPSDPRGGRGFLERVLWPEFDRLHREIESCFGDVTDRLIEGALGSEGEDGSLDWP
jgi:hypothetical protein